MNFNQFINKQNIIMTEDEHNVYDFLKQHDPKWSSNYIDHLLDGRDKVSQRLITSLHRENLVKSRDYSRVLNRRQFAGYGVNVIAILEIYFPTSNIYLYAPITGMHAFDRLDVEGPFYFKNLSKEDDFERVLHPNQILDWILIEDENLNNEASIQFRNDLNNSAANMTFALSFQHHTMRNERAPLYHLIKNANDSYLRSEQSVVEGHPLHPGAKLRKGMNAGENFMYSSEFGNVIHLKAVFIHKSISRIQSLNVDYNDAVKQMFPDLIKTLEKEFGEDFNLQNYHLMMVHPWQIKHILQSDYQDELNEKLILISNHSVPYYAGLSFRTLVPKQPDLSPHIKLSTNVHITGEIRTLSEQTTYNGPLVTQILREIMSKDEDFSRYQSTYIDENAGIHFYNRNDNESIQTDRSEQLGTLFRNNLYQFISNETVPVIPSSLVATYPYNTEAPICTLIKTYQNTHQYKNFEEAAKQWIKDYSKALLGLVIPLYSKYGISLEAHLQNSVATFNKDGALDMIYIRDFEGLRIDNEQLNNAGFTTQHFHEKSRILTNSKTSVFNKMFYSTVQNHLGELVITIAKYSDSKILEQEIWQIIAQTVEDIFNHMTHISKQHLNNIKRTIFASEIDYKCVTTMRLEDQAHEYTYIKVNNPLHRKNDL